MGDFRIEIAAVGGHGCERQIKDGGTVYGCRRFGCPDCETREFVSRLQGRGMQVKKAVFTHWPEEPGEVVDNLLTRERRGSFPA